MGAYMCMDVQQKSNKMCRNNFVDQKHPENKKKKK